MDGNGRWAKQRGLDRSEGHVEGVNTVRRITEIASEVGVKYLTLYTFSTENWNRPEDDALMNLIVVAIERETPDLIKNNVRLSMIGDSSRMPEFAVNRLNACIKDTSHCNGLNLVLALSYSSRQELVSAVKSRRASQKRHIIYRRHQRGGYLQVALHFQYARPRLAYPHCRRPPNQQLSPLANRLCRTLFHRQVLARFLERRFLPSDYRLPKPRTPFRENK